MTREEAKEFLLHLSYSFGTMAVEYLNDKDGEMVCDAIKALEQEPCDDCVSKQAVLDALNNHKYSKEFCEEHHIDWSINLGMAHIVINDLPFVTPQSKIGHCKDCKWWKDSDGSYNRGIGAESQCPMNRIEVFEGTGYCFLYEPQESEE